MASGATVILFFPKVKSLATKLKVQWGETWPDLCVLYWQQLNILPIKALIKVYTCSKIKVKPFGFLALRTVLILTRNVHRATERLSLQVRCYLVVQYVFLKKAISLVIQTLNKKTNVYAHCKCLNWVF